MDQFEKVQPLGRGAQGSVILVRRKSDSRFFVIKQIFLAEHPEQDRDQILNEIKILAHLAHPNIVAFYGSFFQGEDLNLVMEYADGGTLFNHIASARDPFPEDEIMPIMAQLVLCLHHLHGKKVIHRDLKTKNIFLTSNKGIKLGDFGLSKLLGSQSSMAQSAVGTPYYLSPELCEGKPYDYKSDIWALGCVVYELTTLRHAFHATNLPALVMTIVQVDFKPVPTSYNPELRDLIHSCLQKDPDSRPDAAQLLAHPLISKWLPHLPTMVCDGDAESFVLSGDAYVETEVEKSVKKQETASTDAVMREVQQEQQFLRLLVQMRKEVGIKDQVHDRVPYFQCFQAKDLINFMCRELGIVEREEARAAAQKWMDAGVFYHVTRTEAFVDGSTLYRFAQDEVNSILNMRCEYAGSVRPAVTLEQELRGMLAKIMGLALESDTSKLIDYTALVNSQAFAEYTVFCAELQKIDLLSVSFNVKIAIFINLYNLLVIHGFLVVGPPKSIYQRIHFFNHTSYNVGGNNYSLNDIEHGILRGNSIPPQSYCRVFRPNDERLKTAVVVWDPRIHFALVKGTIQCPRLKVYEPDQLEDMLNDVTTEYCSEHVEIRWLGDQTAPPFSTWSVGQLKDFLLNENIDFSTMREKSELIGACKSTLPYANNGELARREMQLPALFEMYRDDFGATEADLLYWIRSYVSPELKADLDRALKKDDWVIRYEPYDAMRTNAAASRISIPSSIDTGKDPAPSVNCVPSPPSPGAAPKPGHMPPSSRCRPRRSINARTGAS